MESFAVQVPNKESNISGPDDVRSAGMVFVMGVSRITEKKQKTMRNALPEISLTQIFPLHIKEFMSKRFGIQTQFDGWKHLLPCRIFSKWRSQS